jgi:phosphoribosylformylglycinamidine cyclo-ligase
MKTCPGTSGDVDVQHITFPRTCPLRQARRRPSYAGHLSAEHSYAAAGVSLATAGAVVERLRAAVESTGATSFGAFAGLHRLDADRFLAASTDGVGTKLILARARGRLRDCGADLAAHCINDVLTCGAEPLMFLDYVAANEIRLDEVAELVEGAAASAARPGSRWSGRDGRAAGHLCGGRARLAGTAVGVVANGVLIDGSTVEAGDRVVGFASAGVHANGFTLVRRARRRGLRRRRPARPTRLYLDVARSLRGRAKAFAHVTGGGILGNLERVLPPGARPTSTGTRGTDRRCSTGSRAT